MLTNSDREAKSTSFSLVARHDYDFGLDWMVGYAFTDAEDISPMTGSTAGFRRFDNLATNTIVNPEPGISKTTTRLTASRRVCPMASSLQVTSRITAMFYRKQGQGQSHVMGSVDLEGDGTFGRHLYVPGLTTAMLLLAPTSMSRRFKPSSSAKATAKASLTATRTTLHGHHTRPAYRSEIPTFLRRKQGRVYLQDLQRHEHDRRQQGLQYDAQFFSQQVVDSNVKRQGVCLQHVQRPRPDRSARESVTVGNASWYPV